MKLNWFQRRVDKLVEGLPVWDHLEGTMQGQVMLLRQALLNFIDDAVARRIKLHLENDPLVVNMSVDLLSPYHKVVRNRPPRRWNLDTGQVTSIIEQPE